MILPRDTPGNLAFVGAALIDCACLMPLLVVCRDAGARCEIVPTSPVAEIKGLAYSHVFSRILTYFVPSPSSDTAIPKLRRCLGTLNDPVLLPERQMVQLCEIGFSSSTRFVTR